MKEKSGIINSLKNFVKTDKEKMKYDFINCLINLSSIIIAQYNL